MNFLKIYLFYLFIFGCIGSLLCARAFPSCSERGPLFVVVRRPLTAVAPLVEHRLQAHRLQHLQHVGLSSCGLRAPERRLSSCGTRAQPLHTMWDLPGPGLEPMSPALAGGFSTTAPPGKPRNELLMKTLCYISIKLL